MTWRAAEDLSIGRLIRHAALRGPIYLNGSSAACRLIGIVARKKQARIEFGDGRRRTVPIGGEIAQVDEFNPDRTPGGGR